jgi:hypothetical protein
MRHLLRRVTDQDIDSSELRDGGVDDRAAVCRVGQVARHEHRLAAGLLYPAGGLPRVVVLVEVGDEHVGAFPGERDGHGPADARCPRR